MQDNQLIDLAKVEYKQPELPWEQRRQKIQEDLTVIIRIFKQHTDDQEFIGKLEKLEEKFKWRKKLALLAQPAIPE